MSEPRKGLVRWHIERVLENHGGSAPMATVIKSVAPFIPSYVALRFALAQAAWARRRYGKGDLRLDWPEERRIQAGRHRLVRRAIYAAVSHGTIERCGDDLVLVRNA